jgi:tetracycline repressor-like protein
MAAPQGVTRKEAAMEQDNRTDVVRRRVGRITAALRDAQARGEVMTACEPEVVAHFLVASLEGAVFVSEVTDDATVVEQCVSELERYLALYEVRS